MFRIYFVLTLIVPLCVSRSSEITFKNVTFRGYSVFTEKFKKTIKSSYSLKDEIPDKLHDMIEFIDQEIPILYKGSLADLQDLDELVIENCGVYEIRPGALNNVPQLRRMSLKGNKIEHIQNEVFSKQLISTLDLGKNSITTIDAEAFNDMPNLLNINLADNKISSWNSNWFKSTPLLTRISMQNNSITSLPANAFKNLKGVKKFGKVDLTINFVFSHNKISKINPKAFVDLKKINNLWLDYNLLENFSDDLLTEVQVNDLRIDNNQITCLEGDLSNIFNAKATHVDGNPFDCECLENIKNWSKKSGKNVDWFYSDMNCMTQRIRKKMTALEKRLKELKYEPIK